MRCDATEHSITTVKRCGGVYGHDPGDAHRFDVADLPRCTNHDRNRDGTSTQQCTKWVGHDDGHRYVEPVYADARYTQEELAKVTEQRDIYSAELATTRESLRVDRYAACSAALDEEKRRRETAEAKLAEARSRLEAMLAKLEAIEVNYNHVASTTLAALARADAPIPMLLICPACGDRHVDAGEFATKSHHTHACQSCGTVWRPAIVATVGVQFLPGFKDEVST